MGGGFQQAAAELQSLPSLAQIFNRGGHHSHFLLFCLRAISPLILSITWIANKMREP
jgi:hypothetical protein